MFDDVGAEGLSEPAAYTPDDASAEKAKAEMIPSMYACQSYQWQYCMDTR